MAAEFDLGFHCYQTMGTVGPVLDRHAASFPNAQISESQIIPFVGCFGSNSVSVAEMMVPFSPNLGNFSSSLVQDSTASSSSTCSLLLDSVPEVKHDTGVAVDWSSEEQYKLEEGLDKYGDEMNILKYIKIAVELPEKSVRDVALRCRWMKRKRRKGEETVSVIRLNDRKNKQMDSQPVVNSPLSQTEILSSIPVSDIVTPTSIFHYDGKICATKHLLDRNTEAFSQITSNLSSFKVQDNVNLFLETRNNINAMLKELSEMQGIMMPSLTVCVDDNLVKSLISTSAQLQFVSETKCLGETMGGFC